MGAENYAKVLYSPQIKKLAKQFAEKIAGSLVPGVGWVSLGWTVANCGIKSR